jgi:diketogulonate reductase-like aldo/keto reductase
MKTIRLPSGDKVPALGLGTWNMGDRAASRAEEIAALRLGLDLGLTLIDTAEMYGSGRSETLVGEAIAGRRDEVLLVSKVLPENATRRGTVKACEKSLERLKTDRLDLYLLHWRGSVPFTETLEAFDRLQAQGKIRQHGVSNLDFGEMREWHSLKGGAGVAVNQVLYNLSRRGLEWDLAPWMRQHHIPIMAYSPLEQARLLSNRKLAAFAKSYEITPAQAALGWLLAQDEVIVIPKSGNPARVKENAGALAHALSPRQLAELDAIFPPPAKARPLEML